MRAFQFVYLLLFLCFYLLLSYSTYKSLSRIEKEPSRKKDIGLFILFLSTIFVTGFILIYIWPLNTQNLHNYKIPLLYNALLSIDFAAKVPLSLSFLAGLFFDARKKQVVYFTGLILSVGMVLSIIYGSLFGKNELDVKHIEIGFKDLPKEFDGLKLMQISDLHLGTYMHSTRLAERVVQLKNQNNPDLIVFTGDLVNNFSNEVNGWEPVFKRITENKDCYSILGNHDYGNYSKWDSENKKIQNFNEIVASHKLLGFHLLNNEHIKIKKGSDSIYVIGVENWGRPPFPQYANLEKALSGIQPESFKILLSHDPAHWEEVVKKRGDVQLTLSGHTHGMQLGISRGGLRYSLSYLTRHDWSGLYKFGENYLYVNVGLGMVGIPWRINMPAEVTFITLQRIEID